MTQQEFNYEIETKAAPPKGIVWKLLGGIIKAWLFKNADAILIILLTLVLGEKKAKQVVQVISTLKE